MKKVLLAALSVLVLLNVFACSKGMEETKYKLESKSDSITVEYTFKHEGDEVKNIKYDQYFKYSEKGISTEALEKQLELIKDNYNIPGINYTVEIRDTELKEVIDVDVVVADKKKLQELGLIQSNNPDAKYLSLKMTTKAIEALGGKKVE